jgi:hypothetical protein
MVHGKFQKKAWLMLFFLAAWSLWLFQNDLIFEQKSPSYDTVFFLIGWPFLTLRQLLQWAYTYLKKKKAFTHLLARLALSTSVYFI